MKAFHIRPVEQTDHARLLALWERSVRATHTFLGEADIAFYRPLVAEIFASEALELWVLADTENIPAGFLGLSDAAIEALFLEPADRGLGYGRRLVAHAQDLRGGALSVDVNEQNTSALGFYKALGFVVVGRSALDGTGHPFPLLHMRREAPPHEDAVRPHEPDGVLNSCS